MTHELDEREQVLLALAVWILEQHCSGVRPWQHNADSTFKEPLLHELEYRFLVRQIIAGIKTVIKTANSAYSVNHPLLHVTFPKEFFWCGSMILPIEGIRALDTILERRAQGYVPQYAIWMPEDSEPDPTLECGVDDKIPTTDGQPRSSATQSLETD